VSRWREQIGDPTLADGILNRLVHHAHRIEMRGESMRKARREKGENDKSSAGKKLWKSRAQNALGNRFAIPTFPQLRRRPHLPLDDRDHFLQKPPASLASLRRLITSLRNADHDQLGIPITFAGIPTLPTNAETARI
jgi:hypothetical protein